MAAATIEGAGASASEEADVVNPIVFFDITLGGEFFFDENPPPFILLFGFISIIFFIRCHISLIKQCMLFCPIMKDCDFLKSFEGETCVCVFFLYFF